MPGFSIFSPWTGSEVFKAQVNAHTVRTAELGSATSTTMFKNHDARIAGEVVPSLILAFRQRRE